MTQRRSRVEVYLDVLIAIKNGTTKPTRIMYGANLSWKPLMQILRSMVSQGLIMEIDTRSERENLRRRYDKRTIKRYEITQKGENVIRYFRHAREVFKLEEAPRANLTNG